MQHPYFYLASGVWNFGLGMTWLVVPLYAHAQGLPNADIGLLFATPVLAQAVLNLIGGAYTDRIGGRRIMLASCLVTVAAGLWFRVAHGFWMLLAGPIILYAVLCAYISALPFSLTVSFYPLFLADYGYSEEASGLLMALRAVGSIAASLLGARMVRTGPETFWPVGCGLAVTAAVGLMPTINHALPIGFWMLVLGAGSAAMTLYFQITISEASPPELRGSALALGGLGSSLS